VGYLFDVDGSSNPPPTLILHEYIGVLKDSVLCFMLSHFIIN
jgi:hypothetical protein